MPTRCSSLSRRTGRRRASSLRTRASSRGCSAAIRMRSRRTGASRRNARTLLRVIDGAELWAVVKADGYGHGAVDVSGAAIGAGATALCVATVAEALPLRREFPSVRIVVLGPATEREVGHAREANLELVVTTEDVPLRVRVHVKLDTGMGRWGLSEL